MMIKMIRTYCAKIGTLNNGTNSYECRVRSVMAGTFIAFSPFIGLHSVMVLVSSWLFRLNTFFVGVTAYSINNPWTMIPIYLFEYALGYTILHTLLSIPVESINPSWMTMIDEYVKYYVPIKGLSFWAFLLGGHIVSPLAMGLSYIIMKRTVPIRVECQQ